jgi:hypothetical protein
MSDLEKNRRCLHVLQGVCSERAIRIAAYGNKHLGTNQINLTNKKVSTCLHFILRVFGTTSNSAFYGVCYITVLETIFAASLLETIVSRRAIEAWFYPF